MRYYDVGFSQMPFHNSTEIYPIYFNSLHTQQSEFSKDLNQNLTRWMLECMEVEGKCQIRGIKKQT